VLLPQTDDLLVDACACKFYSCWPCSSSRMGVYTLTTRKPVPVGKSALRCLCYHTSSRDHAGKHTIECLACRCLRLTQWRPCSVVRCQTGVILQPHVAVGTAVDWPGALRHILRACVFYDTPAEGVSAGVLSNHATGHQLCFACVNAQCGCGASCVVSWT
jgi:hypothetical protein